MEIRATDFGTMALQLMRKHGHNNICVKDTRLLLDIYKEVKHSSNWLGDSTYTSEYATRMACAHVLKMIAKDKRFDLTYVKVHHNNRYITVRLFTPKEY